MQKLLNKIIWIYLNKAYTQMERSGDLQNGDKIAEFIEDYYTTHVKQQAPLLTYVALVNLLTKNRLHRLATCATLIK